VSRPRSGARHGRRAGTRSRVGLIGIAGELLITLGVLIALFAGWQLWWTDVSAGRSQAQAISRLDWPAAPSAIPQRPAEPHREPAPTIPEPQAGITFGVLHVPRWGSAYQVPISEGIDRATILNVLGIGHYPGTAMPGAVGNFAVAAHRTTYGKPFSRIAELEVGDSLVVRTEQIWYVYRVTGHEVVKPSQVEVIAPVPGKPGTTPTTATITLTTCHPQYSARERYVVHGLLEYWMPVSDGTPVELGTRSARA